MRGPTPPAALAAQVAAGTLACALTGCGRPGGGAVVTADGSSTLYPLSEAVAEDLQRAHPAMRVTVSISGTDGGLQKLCTGEVDICAASRTIRPGEAQACDRAGVTYVEIPVAFDGIALVASRKNTWADHLTTAELRRIWEPAAEGRVSRWSDVRPGWPERPLRLFGAGVDSGTYETISRGTYQPLSRLLFLYVSRRSLARPEVDGFVTFYLQHAADLAGDVGLIPLPESAYARARARVTSPTE